MARRRVDLAAAVVGGSAGAFDILRMMLRALPATVTVPIVIVIHLPPHASDTLTELLGADSALPVKFAEDKEPLQGGTVYLAPPGYHLLVESGRTFALSMDEPVHYSRPAIDVLFESVRDAYGRNLLAILLSGASDDGAAGMQEIAAAGGITIVQEPESAEAAIMPLSALALFTPTHVWPPARIAGELPRLLGAAGMDEGRGGGAS